jgi:hypothetical protein
MRGPLVCSNQGKTIHADDETFVAFIGSQRAEHLRDCRREIFTGVALRYSVAVPWNHLADLAGV